jgi:anti-sigma factor RsiW
MFCDEVLETIEPIASGELTPSPRMVDHLGSCRGCAAALESARRVDALLRSRAAPPAPAQFSSRVMSRMRRARWRSEQWLDWGFNVALALAGSLVVAGLWMVMRQSGLATVSGDAIELLGPGMMLFVRRVSPSVPLYAAATALLGTALAVWWWAERDTGRPPRRLVARDQ